MVQRIVPHLALTIMVILRNDLGYRLLNPLSLFATFGMLGVITILATPGHEADRPYDLLFFLGIGFASGMVQRIRGWWQLNRSNIQRHSYYIGTSPFDLPWMPNFLRRNRRISRWVDPLLCVMAGLALLPVSHFLAIWLIVAGYCLRAVEDMVWTRERTRVLDLVDNLIISGEQADTMERYEAPVAQQQQHDEAIPTGIGADIESRIKQRKAGNRPD
jgi:hypothetical protein